MQSVLTKRRISKMPKHLPKVHAMSRPGALPMPGDRAVSAFTKSDVFDRWNEDAAGIRALTAGDNVITMFDVIGEDYWSGGGITAKKVTAQLRAIGDRPVADQFTGRRYVRGHCDLQCAART
jgi:ATP-dependent Clp protease, protease subunit